MPDHERYYTDGEGVYELLPSIDSGTTLAIRDIANEAEYLIDVSLFAATFRLVDHHEEAA
jgi:hypothetical protein